MAHSPTRSVATRLGGTVAPVPPGRDVRREPETPVFRGGRPFLGPQRQAGKRRAGCKCPRDEVTSTRERAETRPKATFHARLVAAGEPIVALCPRKVHASAQRRRRPRVECVFEHLAGRTPGAGRTGRIEFRGPTLRAHPFTSERFHVLLNSLFKVLFNFPSRYLSAIGLVTVFSLRWSLPPTLGCILKQPDSWDARSRRVPRR